MLGSLKMTFVLLAILVFTVISSTLALHNQGRQQNQNVPDQKLIQEQRKKQEHLRSQFPIVDYDAPEITDPKEHSKRKEKNKRFDKRNLVSGDPTTRVTSMARVIEGYNIPPLPVSKSGLIITGEVLTSQAYLSNDKSGVYTELTIRVQEVIKNSLPVRVNKRDLITVEREGGIVRYSNGHQRLHQLAEEGMPTVARQYVLFLRDMEQGEDYYLLTGYELSPTGVVPVDDSQQFKAYEGYDTEALMSAIRSAIQQP
jgi:hypothetical protein